MPQQFDFAPGFDLTSVVSATQGQVQQAIAQIAPLSNVGGIIFGTTAPDIANNVRFSRYMWIDTSGGAPYVLKTYNGAAWVASTVGAGSISAAAQIVDGIITLAKLSVAGGGAGKLIRVNAGNTAFEFINFSDLLSAGSVPFTAIEATGSAANYFLKRNNANTAYDLEPFAASFIPVNSIGYTQLANALTANKILRSSAAANAWEQVDHVLANLGVAGGTAYQIPRINAGATAPEWFTPATYQTAHTEVTAASSSATVIPLDNTSPTNVEGALVAAFETTITPQKAANFLLIDLILQVSASAALHASATLWNDPATGAVTTGIPIAAGSVVVPAVDNFSILHVRCRIPCADILQKFIKLRFGPNGAGTVYINRGDAAGNNPIFSAGICHSSLRVTEVST